MGTCKLRAFRDEWLLTRVRLMPLLDVKVVPNAHQQGGQFIISTHRVASIDLSRRVSCYATRRHVGCGGFTYERVRHAVIGRMLRGM